MSSCDAGRSALIGVIVCNASEAMTQLGHMLTGAAIGILCMPERAARPRIAAQVIAFAALANLPDTPLPGWATIAMTSVTACSQICCSLR